MDYSLRKEYSQYQAIEVRALTLKFIESMKSFSKNYKIELLQENDSKDLSNSYQISDKQVLIL